MAKLIYQNKTFPLIDREWNYDINEVICQIEKSTIPFEEIQEFFPVNEPLSQQLTLDFEVPESEMEDNTSISESINNNYIIIDTVEENNYYKLIFQYKNNVKEQQSTQLAANLDYLATMLDIDLSE